MGILYGSSSCILVKAGITKLSELEIDADKDWNGKGITSLKELAAGMARGDILVHDGALLARVSPGSIGHEFTSAGGGHMPGWSPPPEP